MKSIALAAALALAAAPALAQDEGVTATPVTSETATNSGQPITLPQGPVEVTVTRVVIPAGTTLPVHKHPYPRYAEVETGRILVMNLQTGTDREYGPGDFIVEAVGQWHTGAVISTTDVRLLVIDQHPPGEGNTVQRVE
ncbi:MAG TPA: cupin domain-containing protein [Caulobacteraceae bacterium]